MLGAPDWALDEEMVTIRPQPTAIMSGTARLQAGERPGEVHRQHPVPLLGRDFCNRVECFDSRAGDDDGHRSEILADGLVHAIEGLPVDDIDLVGDRRMAFARELGRDPADTVAIEVEERHRVPIAGEPAGDALTDARRGAGDHRHPGAHLDTSAGVNSR